MSVINKMLRDLDARRVMLPGMPAETTLKMGTPRWGHAPVLPQLEQPKRWYWFAGFALLAMAAGAGYLSSRFHSLDEETNRTPHSTIIVTSDPAFISNPLPVTEQTVNLPVSTPAPAVIAATVTSQMPSVTQAIVTAPVASTSVPVVMPPKVLAPQVAPTTPNTVATVGGTAPAAAAVMPALNKPAVMPVHTAPVQVAAQTPTASLATPKVQATPAPLQPIAATQTLAVSPVAPKPMPAPAQPSIAPAIQAPIVATTANKPAPVTAPVVPAQSTQAKLIPVQPAPTPAATVKPVTPVPTVTAQAPVQAAKVQTPPTVAAPVQTTAVPAPQVNPPKPAAVIAPVTAAPKPASNPPAVMAPVANATSPNPVAPAPVAQPNRQAATQEALAQAQGLWNTGSRDAAVDLMREAVAVTESAYNAGKLSADSPVLVSLVRELTRMELTEGRPLRVLELLIRLEPAITKQADLWAVRGNAAQRLSRHQESVMSYSKALAIRPDEPRWMLASAVSLAALGRLEESAVLADKANAAGVVSSEILAYLKQIGVPVKPI